MHGAITLAGTNQVGQLPVKTVENADLQDWRVETDEQGSIPDTHFTWSGPPGDEDAADRSDEIGSDIASHQFYNGSEGTSELRCARGSRNGRDRDDRRIRQDAGIVWSDAHA